MTESSSRALLRRFGQFADQFARCFNRQTQRDAASQYLDGLFNDSERKSMQAMHGRLSDPGSYEALLHASGRPEIALLTAADGSLRGPRLQRAIGVVYRPETERVSHYFETDLPRQFDALVHIDRTSAVVPLERSIGWDRGELPDTYPYAV